MDSLKEWIDCLAAESRPVIVEGKKDKAALKEIGVKTIITLDRPLFEIIEKVSDEFESVIILTDLDKEGKELFGKLSSEFGKRGIYIESKYRDFLFTKTSLSQIEGLTSYRKHKGKDHLFTE